MASVLYLQGRKIAEEALLGIQAAPTGTLKLEYMATSYTPDVVNHKYWSDISASKASGAPTETLANAAVTIDTSRVEVDTADVSESGTTTTTDKYVLKLDTGTDSTSPLIACIDIAEGTLSPVAGTLALTFNANGHYAVKSTA